MVFKQTVKAHIFCKSKSDSWFSRGARRLSSHQTQATPVILRNSLDSLSMAVTDWFCCDERVVFLRIVGLPPVGNCRELGYDQYNVTIIIVGIGKRLAWISCLDECARRHSFLRLSGVLQPPEVGSLANLRTEEAGNIPVLVRGESLPDGLLQTNSSVSSMKSTKTAIVKELHRQYSTAVPGVTQPYPYEQVEVSSHLRCGAATSTDRVRRRNRSGRRSRRRQSKTYRDSSSLRPNPDSGLWWLVYAGDDGELVVAGTPQGAMYPSECYEESCSTID